MWSVFNSSASKPLSEAEKALKGWGIKYEKKPDGSILVHGNLDLSSKGLTELPDLSFVTVVGNFSCSGNQLTSLVGAPQSVGGGFYCHSNHLTSLEHAPQSVGGSFRCHNNQLTSLEHAPPTVGGDLDCSNNQLTSLEHAPHTVGGDYNCSRNQLTSLKHAPQSVGGGFYCHGNQITTLEHVPPTVGGDFWCHNNQLTSLAGAPQKFQNLQSDFGDFPSWSDVPEELRVSPETKARLEQDLLTAATVLQAAMRISAPLKLKSKAFRA